MSESTEIDQVKSSVPALASTPAIDIDGSDITLPRIYLGQDLSGAVQEGNAKKGDVYTANGGDDPDADVLWENESGAEGVLFHVIGIGKSLSGKDENDEFATWQWGDPEAPKEAWKTYHYTVVAPEVDQSVPLKFTWSRSQTPAAKVINTAIAKAAQNGKAAHEIAFRLTTFQKNNPKGKGTYTVPRVVPAEATEANVALANELSLAISGTAVDVGATGEEPAI